MLLPMRCLEPLRTVSQATNDRRARHEPLASTVLDDALAQELSERLADVFRTADGGDVLADDVFLDGHPPLWRFQLQGRDTFDAWIKSFMPDGADTTVVRTIPTVTGFVTEFTGRHEENGEEITDRKILLAEVRAWRIAELTIYCSGDWNAELRAVTPPRPSSSGPERCDDHDQRRGNECSPGSRPPPARSTSTAYPPPHRSGGDGPRLLLLHGGIECLAAPCGHRSRPLARHPASWHPTSPASASRLRSPSRRRRLRPLAHRLASTPWPRAAHRRRPLLVGSSHCPARHAWPPRWTAHRVRRPRVGPYRMPLAPIRRHPVAIRPTRRNAERFDRFALLDLDATRRRDPDWYDAFEPTPGPAPASPPSRRRCAGSSPPRPSPSRTPSSTASTFPPLCCGAATTAWSRSRSAKPPHHAMAGPCASSTAPPTPPTSSNPKHSWSAHRA